MKTVVEASLKVGDSQKIIEEFFSRQKLPVYFDEFNNRYQAKVPDSKQTDWKGLESVMMVYVYVDAHRAVKRTEVKLEYTWF